MKTPHNDAQPSEQVSTRANWKPLCERSLGAGTLILAALLLFSLASPTATAQSSGPATASVPLCEPGAGDLELPDGFCAVVVADTLGKARHMAVRENGDLYVALREVEGGGGIVALRDTTGDGVADVQARFGEVGGTGLGLRNGYLYFAPDTAVWRYELAEGELAPPGSPETVVGGFLEQGQHAVKSFTFDEDGWIYVNGGAPSNACQEELRTPGTPGMDPCPQLERQAGIWRFRADSTGQTQTEDGERYATGIRNAVALDWDTETNNLYVAQHGRDQLHSLWDSLYTQEQSAELPAEEFLLIEEGSDSGWPYCYYDPFQEKKVLAPEYGGDGQEVGRCADKNMPLVAMPAHWAPNDLLFYTGGQFPERYQNGAFVALHGSWNRAPLPQQGYRIVFIPFEDGRPTGDYETFANGFAHQEVIESPGEARYRPTGLAQGPDGSLYISDDAKGRIWRVVYVGDER